MVAMILQAAPCAAAGVRCSGSSAVHSTARPAAAPQRALSHCPGRRTAHRQQRCLLVRAYDFDDEEEEDPTRYEYPNPQFIKETLEAFPDQGVANIEEARALWQEGGYTYLDVRPQIEWDDIGHVRVQPGAPVVNVPIKHSVRKYNAEKKGKFAVKTDNPDFVAQVEKKFPDKECKLLIGCSDGRAYSMDALMQLDEAGYTNIAGTPPFLRMQGSSCELERLIRRPYSMKALMQLDEAGYTYSAGIKGGYYAWASKFTNKLERRRIGEYAENYSGSGSDSTGIHASGAGFERSDFVEDIGKFKPPPGY